MSKTFRIGNIELPYFIHSHNNTARNERKVEVALGNYFMDKFDNVLEVGAVMPYYGRQDHDVVDTGRKNDKYKRIIKADATEYDYTDRNVLSISTIEHMQKHSFDCLSKIVAEASNYLITYPIGFNKGLDTLMSRSPYNRIIMKKRLDKWVLVEDGLDFNHDYIRGSGATAICIFTNLEEFYDIIYGNG